MEDTQRARRIGLYLLGALLVLIGIGAFGLATFAAAWDNAWGSTTDPAEIAPFFITGLVSVVGAFVAIRRGFTLRPGKSTRRSR